MCTVSYIPEGRKVYITSNRDEHVSRPPAYEPTEEVVNDCRVVFPKDPAAGGTWFAVNEQGAVSVLLNGAFEKHVRQTPYRKSRGLVLLDIITNPVPVLAFGKAALEQIEPFTIVLSVQGRLVEMRWDGTARHHQDLDPAAHHIWSSVTLYSPEAIRVREDMFAQFIRNGRRNGEAILDFHSGHHNDPENGFVMNRPDGLMTFSITQAVLEPREITMLHKDLRLDKTFRHSFVPAPRRPMLQ